MKLIVEIPDEEYQKWNVKRMMDATIVKNALFNGIELPKGHGRIIDESKIKNCGWNFIDHHAKTDAPTIIEADKAEYEPLESEV